MVKSSKGSVVIENNHNRLRLRWSINGERYSLALGLPHNKINLKAAQKIAAQIELDILSGYFDATLNKYRSLNSSTPKTPKPSNLNSTYLLPIWNEWVSSLNLSERTRNVHYKAILRHIEKANPFLDDASWFECLEYSPRIFNDYLRYLNSCMRWAIDKGIIK